MSWTSRLTASLRGRLLLSLTAAIVVSLATWLFIFHVLVRNELYGSFDDSLVAHMQALAAYAVRHPGAEGIAEFMPEFRTLQHQDFFQVWDASGRVLARSDSSAGRTLPVLGSRPGTPTFHDLDLPDGHAGRAVAQLYAVAEGDPRGHIVVATAAEIQPLVDLEERLHGFVFICALATVLVSLAIASYSVRRSLRPVEDLARSVSAINPEDPQARLDVGGLPSELAPVAAKVQAMLWRLIEALGRERRFARNVAHELRTPLAEARMLAEVGAMSENMEAARRAFGEIGQTTDELEQIVESLLSLSRYESGLQRPEPEPLDLRAELRHEAQRLDPASRARGLEVALDTPQESWVFADAALVRRLIANLLGNAVAHAPAGSTIEAQVAGDGALTIDNPAPQLRAEDIPRLGECFFRIGKGGHGYHAGLGLALAQAVARVLGLELTLTLTETGHLRAVARGFRPLPG
jgi:two-component system sensor histidine kinase QseC